MAEKRNFVIIMGPSGSGKTTLRNQYYKDYVSLNIDDIIEADEVYINLTTEYIKSKLLNEIITDIKLVSEYLTKIYFERRDYFKQEFSKYLEETIINAKHDIVFESTGIAGIDWIFEERFNIRNNYVIHVVYPKVNPNILESRIMHRFLTTICSSNFKVPRLPLTFMRQGFPSNEKIPSLSLSDTVPIIHEHIKKHIRGCIMEVKKKVDIVTIIENNIKYEFSSNMTVEEYYIFLKKLKL